MWLVSRGARCEGGSGHAGIGLLVEEPELETELQPRAWPGLHLELIMISMENFHCCTFPIVFLAPGPKPSLFVIHRLKEQINSSKLWQMGIL